MAKKDLKREIYNNFPAKLSENENPKEGKSISQNTNPADHQGTGGKVTMAKVGRPKTKDIKNTCKNINVAIPITLLKKWEEIKIVHGSNLTAYIAKLIERDMDANYERYKEIADSLKNI